MPKEKAIDKLKDAEVLALSIWITQHGRQWRKKLAHAYEIGGQGVVGYVPELGHIRARLGVEILDNLDTTEVLKAGELVQAAKSKP